MSGDLFGESERGSSSAKRGKGTTQRVVEGAAAASTSGLEAREREPADQHGSGGSPLHRRRRSPSPLLRTGEELDWARIETDLDAYGCAATGPLLAADECAALVARYDDEHAFRSRVVMARHGFGQGEYKYFSYPLPAPIAHLRAPLYARLAPIANRWNEAMGIAVRYPDAHEDFLARCHAAGQTRPTPLLLKYGPGDYNCLHQDLYGEHVFPLQVAILLSEPGRDFEGGEFVLTEQRPRMQSRAEVVALRQGEAVIFAVHTRPVQGTRGSYRVNLRHGVSRLRSGARYTTGIIFHDAK